MIENQATNTDSSSEQLVIFELANELFGVDIAAVNTIIRMQEITEVPGTPSFVKGIINLRGTIVPVIDLRSRFQLSKGEITKSSRIIVVEASGHTVGVIVDAVIETLKLSSEAIETPPPAVSSVESEYLRGIGKIENGLLILLDTDKVLSSCEQGELEAFGQRTDCASTDCASTDCASTEAA